MSGKKKALRDSVADSIRLLSGNSPRVEVIQDRSWEWTWSRAGPKLLGIQSFRYSLSKGTRFHPYTVRVPNHCKRILLQYCQPDFEGNRFLFLLQFQRFSQHQLVEFRRNSRLVNQWIKNAPPQADFLDSLLMQ